MVLHCYTSLLVEVEKNKKIELQVDLETAATSAGTTEGMQVASEPYFPINSFYSLLQFSKLTSCCTVWLLSTHTVCEFCLKVV
jgi:predicted GNAT superfamily acetyltransferase